MSGSGSAILVVDDNEDNRYTLTRRLAREGYANVAVAVDGREALALLRARAFQLVLLDIMMPGMNGYEVLEAMKADRELRHVPVIMISAIDEMDSVIRCIELGAEDYLPKPFNPTLLRARVGATLEKKGLRDEIDFALHRLERELQAARTLQLGMLPSSAPLWSSACPVHVHAVIEPAREVGGDLYDYFQPSPGRFCFVIGDVSGKGAPAAMYMARARSLVRFAFEASANGGSAAPGAVLEAVNRELWRDNPERMFVTLFAGVLDVASGLLRYANAGHPYPYRCAANGAVPIASRPQPPLGVQPAAHYAEGEVQLGPGDAIFTFTDGVVEAMNEAQELYSDWRLAQVLGSCGARPPEAMVRAVSADLAAFARGNEQADDIAMLAVRWQPPD